MTVKIIGTCSECGGRVSVPTIWMGVHPPRPSCLDCHAVAGGIGPVIKMNPLPKSNPIDRALRVIRSERDNSALEGFRMGAARYLGKAGVE